MVKHSSQLCRKRVNTVYKVSVMSVVNSEPVGTFGLPEEPLTPRQMHIHLQLQYSSTITDTNTNGDTCTLYSYNLGHIIQLHTLGVAT